MSRQDNIVTQEHLADNLNSGDLDAFAENCVDHDPSPDQEAGREGFRTFFSALKKGFPDAKPAPETMVADDDQIAVAYTLSGTHEGEFHGIDATHRRIEFRGVQVARFKDGKNV